MTKLNIAIANFAPKEVFNSSWPRFTGFKTMGQPVLESGLFGLVDKKTRMHAFFKDTTIYDVLKERLTYVVRTDDIKGSPLDISYNVSGVGTIEMQPRARVLDTTIQWLTPYNYTAKDGTVWTVYVLITGGDIYINGSFHKTFKTDGYWDMGIWRPTEEELQDDMFRIEQTTINHVVAQGYPAMDSITMFKDNPDYGKYQEKIVVRELPPLV